MNEVFKILRSIESNSSRNSKKSILIQNQNNENLKKFLLYAYSPRWIYGIGPKSIEKQRKTAPNTTVSSSLGITQRSLFGGPSITKVSSTYADIFSICEELKKHPYGSQRDTKIVNDFLSTCTEEEYYWYSKLLLKDLKIGCSSKTINEVYNELIDVFEVMLAFPIDDHAKKLTKKGPFQIQRKYNGFRFIIYHFPDGELKFFTRNGVELFNFPEIEEDFKRVEVSDKGMLYDGEITDKSDKVNNIVSIAMSEGPKYNVKYHVWDCLTIREFELEESTSNQFSRYDQLRDRFTDIYTPHIEVVEELYRGEDLDCIDKWYDYSQEQGWEGIMVKFNTPYVRKRTDNMLKVKGFETEDLRVIRLEEGKAGGKHEGVLGAVVVDYKGQEVNVGGGFSDHERKLFWENPNMIIDKVIEVRFFEETDNKSGTHSLQHPRYKGIRRDK
jgi:DNA ligase-1